MIAWVIPRISGVLMLFLARMILVALLALILPGCRSPLTELKAPPGQTLAFAVPPVAVEDHSRTLKRIRDLEPGEVNTAGARRAALDGHAAYLDSAFRAKALAQGLRLDPDAPYQLELTLTTVGEVRTKYIVYGILSGVAWGVGTGLVTHNVKLAIGLGAYELAEESLFWIAGSSLFGKYSAPVVLEARVLEKGVKKPVWTETYYVIWGGKHLKAHSATEQKLRATQLHASLERALASLFEDLAKVPVPTAAPIQD
jgi:hypothetical protein